MRRVAVNRDHELGAMDHLYGVRFSTLLSCNDWNILCRLFNDMYNL